MRSRGDSSSETDQFLQLHRRIDIRMSLQYTGQQYGYRKTLSDKFDSYDLHLVEHSLNESRENGRLVRIGGTVATVEFKSFVITDEETLEACENESLEDTKLKALLSTRESVEID